jgi:hypothetical protein
MDPDGRLTAADGTDWLLRSACSRRLTASWSSTMAGGPTNVAARVFWCSTALIVADNEDARNSSLNDHIYS